jgi:hypothetical protein
VTSLPPSSSISLGFLWRSALVLLDYLANRTIFPDGHFKGKNVLEVGAGTGIVGMVCLCCCCASIAIDRFFFSFESLIFVCFLHDQKALGREGANVVLTDLQAMVPLLRENVHLNGLDDCVSVKQLTW